jgi:hypothetical protein
MPPAPKGHHRPELRVPKQPHQHLLRPLNERVDDDAPEVHPRRDPSQALKTGADGPVVGDAQEDPAPFGLVQNLR